jgi:hypothetical protein
MPVADEDGVIDEEDDDDKPPELMMYSLLQLEPLA